MANGIDCSPVISGAVPDKSMGHSRTLPEDIDDPKQIASILLGLSSLVARRLRKGGFMGRTITLRLRYSDFFSLTRSETIPHPTDSEHAIFKVALKLALGLVSGIRKIRLLGVSVSQLIRDEKPLQIPLPLVEYRDKKEEIYSVMDRIRDKFGEESVRWGGAIVFV
jgi:DNA polymerase-4